MVGDRTVFVLVFQNNVLVCLEVICRICYQLMFHFYLNERAITHARIRITDRVGGAMDMSFGNKIFGMGFPRNQRHKLF